MAINEKYSNRDFTHQRFLDVDPAEFSDSEIVNSCFYQEVTLGHKGDPRQDVFPVGVTGLTLRNCNLCNVVIPPGVTLEGHCTTDRICVQNDMDDWFVDSQGKPLAPTTVKLRRRYGVSESPLDIPAAPVDENVVFKAERQKLEEAETAAELARKQVLDAIVVTP